jgi:hypothetical protein
MTFIIYHNTDNYIVKSETQNINKKHENVEKQIYSSSVYSK